MACSRSPSSEHVNASAALLCTPPRPRFRANPNPHRSLPSAWFVVRKAERGPVEYTLDLDMNSAKVQPEFGNMQAPGGMQMMDR
jgi:hypothetical protein